MDLGGQKTFPEACNPRAQGVKYPSAEIKRVTAAKSTGGGPDHSPGLLAFGKLFLETLSCGGGDVTRAECSRY